MESTDLTQRLPEDVLVALLRRLPPHGLAAARCVCKSWHAIIDARRLLDLFPPSLAGLFLNFFDLDISEFFFRPPRDTDTAVSGRLDYVPAEDSDAAILDHCNGLLLLWAHVANPATRRWAPLPQWPPWLGSRHIVFDPVVSPHYEVLKIPKHPWCTAGVEPQHQWPPSPFIMHVFSSTTGIWEERSFARRGDAIGTVAHLKQRQRWSITQDYSAYWRGQLYVLNQFVMRITLSNCTYQAIELPVDVSTSNEKYSLGRSENGVYLAAINWHRRLRVWILVELHGEIEWVLKHDNNLDHMLSRGMYDPQVQGPWRIEDINYNSDHSTSEVNMQEAAEEDKFEWNSDNENTLDMTLQVGKCYTGDITILGFHPYKEVIFLNKSVTRGLAYHLNSSKIEDLGNIYPKDYSAMYMFVEQSFPYTPCWIGKLPGSI
uniref:Uncharacterized protein n=1 Tax=Avena sativa TaxID=4498 RepID=A0ACD5YD05_AVESA